MIKKFSLWVIACLCSFTISSIAQEKISAAALNRIIETNQNLQLIDVRTPDEFSKGHISKAQNINYNSPDFQKNIAALDQSKPVYVYCLSGGRSAAASKALQDKGFDVVEMSGGMMEWRSNNLPEAKPADAGKVSTLNLQQYDSIIQSDQLVLIDFYAPWCVPCKKMAPFLKTMEAEMKGDVTIIKINVDEHTAVANALKISSIPHLKLYRKGKEVWNHIGYINEKHLKTNIKQHIKK